MNELHSLLRRQLKRHFDSDFVIPENWQLFISSVNEAYKQSDNDRNMLERSLDLSSQELLEANTQLRAVFQAIPDLFFCLDKDGKILDCEAGLDRDLFIPREELVGKMIHDAPGSVGSQKFMKVLKEVNETRSVVSMEYSIIIGGKQKFYEARFVPMLEDKSIAIIRDITERERAAHELQERADKLERFQRLTIGREFDMIDLKNEVNELRGKLGLPNKYAVPEQVTQLRTRRSSKSG